MVCVRREVVKLEDMMKGLIVGIVGCAVYDLLKAAALKAIRRAEGTRQGKHFRRP